MERILGEPFNPKHTEELENLMRFQSGLNAVQQQQKVADERNISCGLNERDGMPLCRTIMEK